MNLFVSLGWLWAGLALSAASVVTDINPNTVSTEGGARITIVGEGFTHDLFNFGTGNEGKGVEVNFVSAEGNIVPCDIHKDGCTLTQITCYTRKMEHDVPYTVSVKVNGELVTTLCTANPDYCVIRGHWYNTPRIYDLYPQSGKPGDVILTVYGRIITERFGSNTDISSNGRNEAILRSYTMSNCELKNGTAKTDFYGLYIDNDMSGYLKCKPEGTFVGNTNYTFLVESPFGRSAAEWNVSRVSRTNDIYMIQFYTDISTLSPTQGSTEGGTLLTVSGDMYETAGPLSTYSPLEVYVGGQECKVQEVSANNYVTCITPAKPANKSIYRGNRGVTVEVFRNDAFANNAEAVSSTAAAAATIHLDETKLCGGEHYGKWRRMKGVFVASWDGKFQFQMQTMPGGAVKAEGLNLLETTGSMAYGQLVDLKKGDEIPFVAVAAPSSDPAACVEVRMAHFNTKFSRSMVGRASDEKQRLVFTSTVVPEVQNVSLNTSPRSATQEKQQICDPNGDNFQLCLYEVCTAPTTFTAGDVTEKLNKLPFLATGETFAVAENANCLDITFQSQRGNIPQLTVMSGSMSVSTVTEGVASGNVFSFMFNGVPSAPITYNTADTATMATSMQTALKDMFGVQCPKKFTTHVSGFYDGFESGASGTTTEVAAFCGRYSLKNMEYIYNTIAGKLITGKHFCFAVKGLDNNKIYLKFNEGLNNKGSWTTFTPFLEENTWTGSNDDDNTWLYTCIDLEAFFKSTWPWETKFASYTLVQVKLERTDDVNDFYVDDVMITSNPVLSTDTLTKQRMPGAQPGATATKPKFTMAAVSVTYDAANSNYVVTMQPNDCGHNFRLLAVDDAQSGAVTITSSRVSQASEPVTGSFTLTTYGKTSQPVDPQLTDKEIRTILENKFGKLQVERTDDSTCANMKIDISFLQTPGDLELMTLSTSFTAPATAAGSIEQVHPGHLSMAPIPGDMVYTQHSTPQVVVYVNGVPTKCATAGNDCSFTYGDDNTPTVTAISPLTGNENDVLTITGTGLSATPGNNKVTIGGVACAVTTASATQIQCTLGNGPLATYPIVVSVSPAGRAVNTVSNFTYTADVVSIAPPGAGLGGKVDLVITGKGFTSRAIVTVGGVDCPVKSVEEPTTITCVLPPYSNLSTSTPQTAAVAVTIGTVELVTKPTFTYSPQTSQITGVSPSGTLTAAGNQIIDIAGTNLGASGTVFLGDTQLEVVSYSATAIQVRTPSPSPTGDNIPLMVYAAGSAGAVLNTDPAVPVLSIPYKVQKVVPTSGSLMGGTRLTVVGSGFGTVPADIEARVGDYDCAVLTAADTKFVCEIESTSTEHTVTNMGTSGFGAYFSFSETELEIEEGDTIKWAWQTASFLNDVQHGVFETGSLASTEPLTGGISSGAQARQGSFQHRFTSTGTYYFWSGYVDQWEIKNYRMTVNVVPKAAKLEQFAMFIKGAEPVYDTSSGVADPTDNSGCATRKSDVISGCTPETLTPENPDKFNFLFSQCRTPTLTGVSFTYAATGSPRSAKVDTVVSVSGSQFATGDCANVAYIGDCACTVSGSSATSLQCTPDPSCVYDLGVLLPVNVNVINYGFAKSTIASQKDQSLAFLPTIQSISPASGSRKGGTEVTIMGSGFTDLDTIEVTFYGVEATCTAVQPLVCQSPLSNTGDVAVVVSRFPAICTGASCTFTYDASNTPTVTEISPVTVDGTATTLTFTGTGFGTESSAVSVKIGGEACGSVTVMSATSATCSISAVPAGSNVVTFNVAGVGNADSSSVSITGTPLAIVSPAAGATNGGTTLTFTGHGFKGETTVVTGDGVACSDVQVVSITELTCTTGPHAAAAVNFVITSHGETFPNVAFTYDASLIPTISAINPTTGDSLGNQLLTLTGSHFYSGLSVTVCDSACAVDSVTTGVIVCITPAKGDVSACNVKLTGSGVTAPAPTQYTYVDNDAPKITGLNPQRGGTGGGTSLTISGSVLSGATVSINGVDCAVATTSASEIVCSSGAQAASVQADVLVTAGGKRAVPATPGAAAYYYVDQYSNNATWGGGPVPGAGEMVVIPTGKIVLLDQDTEVLGMLLIDGGQLIFDEKDLTLKAERILITKGGKLHVGSPERRFQHKAVIELYGHHRDEELPIYGTKVLAVREGELNLYGKEIANPWTRLSATAHPSATTITVQDNISDWSVGDSIVIATTGDKFSQGESEEHVISAISGQTITLQKPLAFKHLGVSETFSGVDGADVVFDYRAEVGLLTRNIVFRGNEDPQWTRDIKKCDAGFDPGEFVTQTCFEGRFGEEKGNSQFGAHVLIHQAEKDTQVAQAHLSYAEFTFAGQAFRLGRYPIHFHLNGIMSQSFVEGCAIHKTFNRAINIHGSHNINIRNNVAFNIMGGAFFLEDGIEVNNTYDGNLIVFVRASSSLLNDDITPAAFWATNPYNTYINNVAVGGTHFGWWYRMRTHPDGPSFTTSYCPQRVPLKEHNNNEAHSNGWFGIWTFEEYYPVKAGACSGTTGAEPAVFNYFKAYNNEKGVEFVDFGSLQVLNSVLVQNSLAGYEGKRVINGDRRNPETSATVNNTLIVGRSMIADVRNAQGTTLAGVILPYGESQQLHKVKFLNFPDDAANGDSAVGIKWTKIDGTCHDKCGGFNYQTSNLTFENVDYRIHFRWAHEGIIEDTDGSLCGTPNSKVLPNWGSSFNVPGCVASCTEKFKNNENEYVEPLVCPSNVKFHRLAFNKILPSSLEGKNATLTNQYGSSVGFFRAKRITHKKGWMALLVDGETTTLTFEGAEDMTNISFTGQINELEAGDCVILSMRVLEKPDIVSLNGITGKNQSDAQFNCSNGPSSGDWWFNPANNHVEFAVTGPKPSRRKRGLTVFASDVSMNLKIEKCFFAGCIPPVPKDEQAPPTERPNPFHYWNDNIWVRDDNGLVRTNGTGSIPTRGENVLITEDKWVVINTTTAIELGTVRVEGGLEIDYDSPGVQYEFKVKFLIIVGGRFHVGWPNNPMLGTATIVLLGDAMSPAFTEIDGVAIGTKAIAVFGGLELHGRDVGESYTLLTQTANAGDTVMHVTGADVTLWMTGDTIVVTSTSLIPTELETKTIASVDWAAGTVTLSSPLQYKHSVYSEPLNGSEVTFAAAVGHVTRNIVIQGERTATNQIGGRIVASITQVTMGSGSETRTGYIRARYAKFDFMGQDGFTEYYDPRFAVAYVATGPVNDVKPSIVQGCAFVSLDSSAVGAFGAADLEISNNVVVNPVGNGIVTESDNTRIVNNLVANLLWTGSYDGRNEPFNFRYEAAIFAIGSHGLHLADNYVAGSQRVGYRLPGQDCADVYTPTGVNYAVGNLMGYGVFPDEDDLKQNPSQTCVRISDIAAFRNLDFGFYYNNRLSLNLHKITAADNQVGVYPMVIGAGPLAHECGDERVDVTDSVFVGSTDKCTTVEAPSGVYITNSGLCRADSGPSGTRLGLEFPQITGGSNKAPMKPCSNIMSYNTICGRGKVSGTVFAHFGQCAYAFSLSTKNEDLQQYLVSLSNIKIDVNDDFLLYYPRPNVGKINPADCVDMDCDAMKKALLRDDGSLAGTPASFIPKSEWEWGGDPRRGLSDARVPKDMLTFPNGTVITVDQLAPKGKGISRVDGQCTLKGSASTFEYYKCANVDYETMVIESLDDDTETRRLSPVAILQDGYIDLINGPQDHGWCNGYTCQKRVSLFHALVRPGLPVSVYFTSVQPDKMRYFMMDGKADSCVVVSFYYQNPNRIDIYKDRGTTNVVPKNGRYETVGGKQFFKLVNEPGANYMPTCSDPHGSNYIDRNARLLYFVLKGDAEIQLSKANVVIVSFGLPAMTEAEFFGANIIENLAGMLNIPLEKIRVVSIVSSSGSGRKRRSTGTLAVVLEIGDEPPASLDGASDSTEPVVDVAELVMNACQDGTLDNSLSTSGIQCEEIIIGDHVYQPVEPAGLRIMQALEPEHEGVPFKVQPKIRAYDDNGDLIDHLGIVEDPWKITATLRSGTGHASAVLGGKVTVTSSNGWANFTDLQISHKGSGYIIDFEISHPSSAAALNFNVSTDPFDVDGAPLTAGVYSMTMDNIVTNDVMTLTLELRDSTTNQPIPNINWRGHTFSASCETLMEFEDGSLTGTLSGQFDSTSGHMAFTNWRFTGYGLVYISCQVESVPAEYDFYSFHKVVVLSPAQDAIVVTATSIVTVRFDLDYEVTLPTEAAAKQLEQKAINFFNVKYPEIIISDSSIAKGSIIVTFTVRGKTANVTSALQSICSDISAGRSIEIGGSSLTLDGYMLVDGTDYYSSCTSEPKKHGLHPGYIALIVILCLLVIAAIVFVVVWKFVIKPKAKTHDNGRTVFLASGLTGKDGFYKQTRPTVRPESSAPPITTLYDETPGYTKIRKSPLPPDTNDDAAMRRAVSPTD